MTRADAGERSVRHLEIGERGVGQRLDNFLLRLYRDVPKSRLYRTIRNGEVRVNSRRAKPHQRLGAGDRVRLPPLATGVRCAPRIGDATVAAAARSILYEDPLLIVFDKPANVAAHAGSGHSYGVIDVVRRMRPDADVQLGHRLDKGTSGCLALAKSREALQALHRAFRSGQVQKEYRALVVGRWNAPPEVAQALARDTRGRRADDAGKPALSRFRVLRRYRRHTLMAVRPQTGRTHQIRLHAAHCGHPVAGDRRYGDFAANRALAKHGLRRMFLHARRLSLPWNGRTLECKAPLPPELWHLLERLEREYTAPARRSTQRRTSTMNVNGERPR